MYIFFTIFSNTMDKSLILNKIIEYKNFKSDAEFARFLDISPQNLSKWKQRNSYDIELLYTKCPYLNPEWLLTGNGPMLKEENHDFVKETPSIYGLKTDNVIPDSQQIPLYNIEATAGIVTLFKDNTETTPIDFIQIPNLPKCDGALYVTGDSMYPLLKSGDIIMYKQIQNLKEGIYWGEMYLLSVDLDGDEMVLVKYIQKSDKGENYIKLVSQNKHHQDKDVKLSKVRALALIKASIRMNSMS